MAKDKTLDSTTLLCQFASDRLYNHPYLWARPNWQDQALTVEPKEYAGVLSGASAQMIWKHVLMKHAIRVIG